MKTTILYVFSALVILSIVAWKIQPAKVDDNKIPLVWISDDNPARREQIDLFKRLNPRFNLDLDPNNQGLEKVIVQSIAGVGPDLFDCYDPMSLASFVKSGIAWDVTDELKKSGIDINKDIWQVSLPNIVYQGRVYGFPTNAGSVGLWFNKDIFDRAKIPYPKGVYKWKDIIPLAQRLTIRDKNGRAKQYGLLCDWWSWPQFVMQWGGNIYTKDGTRCILDSPEAIEAVQFMHDMIYKYRVMPSPIEEQAAAQGGWQAGTLTRFAAGQSAMAVGSRYWLCNLRDNKDIRFGAVECPYGKYRVYVGGARSTLINKLSPRRKEALQFLKYLASRDYNELIDHQADGLGPMIRYAYTPTFLHDPEYLQEDYNAMWRDPMKYTVAYPVSPFVSGQVAGRIINKQMDLIKGNKKPVAEAMKTITIQINAEIQKTLEREPEMKRIYEGLVEKAR